MNELNKLCQRRIMGDIRIMTNTPPDYMYAYPDKDNLLKWYFMIDGPEWSKYKGGHYIGQILHDKDYPLKPPDYIMLTPSGRFMINQKICMSNTKFHQSDWNAAWNISSMLAGFLSIMLDDTEHGIAHTTHHSIKDIERFALDSITYNETHYPYIYSEFKRLMDIRNKTKDKINKYKEEINKHKQHELENIKETTQNCSAQLHSQDPPNVRVHNNTSQIDATAQIPLAAKVMEMTSNGCDLDSDNDADVSSTENKSATSSDYSKHSKKSIDGVHTDHKLTALTTGLDPPKDSTNHSHHLKAEIYSLDKYTALTASKDTCSQVSFDHQSVDSDINSILKSDTESINTMQHKQLPLDSSSDDDNDIPVRFIRVNFDSLRHSNSDSDSDNENVDPNTIQLVRAIMEKVGAIRNPNDTQHLILAEIDNSKHNKKKNKDEIDLIFEEFDKKYINIKNSIDKAIWL